MVVGKEPDLRVRCPLECYQIQKHESRLILETGYLIWENAWDELQGQAPGKTKFGFKLAPLVGCEGPAMHCRHAFVSFFFNLDKSTLVTEYAVQDGSGRNAQG